MKKSSLSLSFMKDYFKTFKELYKEKASIVK